MIEYIIGSFWQGTVYGLRFIQAYILQFLLLKTLLLYDDFVYEEGRFYFISCKNLKLDFECGLFAKRPSVCGRIRQGMAWWVIVESYSISCPPDAIAIDVAAGKLGCEVSTPPNKGLLPRFLWISKRSNCGNGYYFMLIQDCSMTCFCTMLHFKGTLS